MSTCADFFLTVQQRPVNLIKSDLELSLLVYYENELQQDNLVWYVV